MGRKEEEREGEKKRKEGGRKKERRRKKEMKELQKINIYIYIFRRYVCVGWGVVSFLLAADN